MYATSFDKIRYSEEWKKRQQLFFKHGNIKKPAVVVPIMIEQLEQRISSWEVDKEIEFVDEFGDMTSRVIWTVLFGFEFLLTSIDGVGEWRIKLKDGSYQIISFTEAVRFIPDEWDVSNDSLLASVFPYLNYKSLIEPFKTDAENIREIHRVLLNFCTKNGTRNKWDIEILKLAEKHLKNIDETAFLNDLFNLLDAGSGTILFAITSWLFRLKQYPEVMRKLMNELEENGVKALVDKRDKFTSEESQGALNKCEYLGYIVKESLRIDPPSLGSSAYESVDDVVVCDVLVPKGTIMYVNTLCAHFNEQQWHEPFKFIPERFDPSSEYYTKPGTDEIRDSNSYIPFSVGPRTCPAVKFATYEIKSMVAYFLCRVEYEVEKYQIDEDIHIGLEGIQELYGKITKKCL